MIAIWTGYVLAAVAASVAFVAAGWRSKNLQSIAVTSGHRGLPADPLWGDAETGIDASQTQTDVAAAMRLALKRLAPVVASQSVHVDVALPPGLPVRMRGSALTDLLEELLAAAVHGAPASRLLLTAAPHGDRVHVGITDDIPGADLAVRLGKVRSLIERVALRGGSLEVDVRPAEGTTMTLRLAAATDEAATDGKEGPRVWLPPELAKRAV
ncbi:MAG TPA: hypothetical protein VGC09_05875 [Rhodopila sp.]